MRTGTGHIGGGMWRVGSRVSDGDNPARRVLAKPEGLQCDTGYGAPNPFRGSTGRRGVGVARKSQKVGERVHTLPRA